MINRNNPSTPSTDPTHGQAGACDRPGEPEGTAGESPRGCPAPFLSPSIRSWAVLLLGALALMLQAAVAGTVNTLQISSLGQSPSNPTVMGQPVQYPLQLTHYRVDPGFDLYPILITADITVKVDGTPIDSGSGEFTAEGCAVSPTGVFDCADLFANESDFPTFTWANPQAGSHTVAFAGSCSQYQVVSGEWQYLRECSADIATVMTEVTAPGTITLGGSSYSGAEGKSLSVTVNRSSGSDGQVSVSYWTTDGSALAGSDYTATSGTLTWADGDSMPKTINVPLLTDAIVEAAETLQLGIGSPTGGATLGSPDSATLTVTDNTVLPPAMRVTEGDFLSAGDVGGPFTPGSKSYTVYNDGGSPMDFSAGTAVDWLHIGPLSGSVEAGGSAQVIVSIRPTANELPGGQYQATLTFTNDSNGAGNTTRSVHLDVMGTAQLVVSPNTTFNVAGKEGSPFTPGSTGYVVANTGDATLAYSVGTDVAWLSATPESGILAPGAEETVTLAITGAAESLAPEQVHQGLVAFTNTTSGVGSTTRQATLVLLPGDSGWGIDPDEGFDDNTSMRAHNVPDNQSVTLRMLVERTSTPSALGKVAIVPANIGFKVKTSTEKNKDVLTFSIDGVKQGEWSGEMDWTPQSFTMPANIGGENELEWTFTKDASGAEGTDKVFVDVINITTSDVRLLASTLPGSRSAQVGSTVTAFATAVNAGTDTGEGCAVALATSLPADFAYQTTDSATNALTGFENTPASIPAGAFQSFVIAFTPNSAFEPTEVALNFDCSNTDTAPSIPGLNTLLLSASTTPVPDIVALAATLDGDGIAKIPALENGAFGFTTFGVATVNLGAGETIRVSADTGNPPLPVSISLCQTNPANAQCLGPIGPSVTTTIGPNETPTFGFFVGASSEVPFAPDINRIFVRFEDQGGRVRGATSVAVQTQ